jgi:hypothetical protein
MRQQVTPTAEALPAARDLDRAVDQVREIIERKTSLGESPDAIARDIVTVIEQLGR